MIDEKQTLQMFGYTSDMLSAMSSKKIYHMCDDCGKETVMEYCNYARRVYKELCRGCTIKRGYVDHPDRRERSSVSAKKAYYDDPSLRERLSAAQKESFANDPSRIKRQSETQRKLYMDNPSLREAASVKMKKIHATDKTLRKRQGATRKKIFDADPTIAKRMSDTMKIVWADTSRRDRQSTAAKKAYAADPTIVKRLSATRQGIPYEEWTGFVSNGEYCEKFNEACKERVREKYDYRCFVCDKSQNENITKNGEIRKLSVHHVDRNKNQGCDGVKWKLVPLCMSCHGKSHSEIVRTRIEYLLNGS